MRPTELLTGPKNRAIGIIRLSSHSKHPDDPSTSPERQKLAIETVCAARGLVIVGWAVDLDISAGIPPWLRPELGELLKAPHTWDVMVMWKLDRLIRKTKDFLELMSWVRCQSHSLPLPSCTTEKDIITADGVLDLSTPMGRAIATFFTVLAEVEREIDIVRQTETRQHLREVGRWAGGRIPYGWIPERQPGGGWRLMLDPETSKVLLKIIEDIVDDDIPQVDVVERLNRDKVQTPLNRHRAFRIAQKQPSKPLDPESFWHNSTLNRILRSKLLIGYGTHKDEVVRDDDGSAVSYTEALIKPARYYELQRILDQTAGDPSSRRTRTTNRLLRVAQCATCKENMYRTTRNNGKKDYTYYYCRNNNHSRKHGPTCRARAIAAGKLEEAFDALLMSRIGDLEVYSKLVAPIEDHAAEIQELSDIIDGMIEERGRGAYRTARALSAYERQLATLETRILELEELDKKNHSPGFVATGETYREVWESLDPDGQRNLLLESGISAFVAASEEDLPDSVEFDREVREVSVNRRDPVVIIKYPIEIESRLVLSSIK